MSQDYKKELEITLESLIAEYDSIQNKTKEAGFAFELKRKNIVEEVNLENKPEDTERAEFKIYTKINIDTSEKAIGEQLRNIFKI
jgi:hypothetical protein